MLPDSIPSTISGISSVVWPTTSDDLLLSIIRVFSLGNGFVLPRFSSGLVCIRPGSGMAKKKPRPIDQGFCVMLIVFSSFETSYVNSVFFLCACRGIDLRMNLGSSC